MDSVNPLFPTANTPPTSKPKKLDANGINFVLQQFKYVYDRNDNVYCQITIRNKKKFVKIDSSDFLSFSQLHISQVYGCSVQARDISGLLPMLRLHALNSGKLVELNNRFARIGEDIYIETQNEGDEVIHINSDGWALTQNPPVIFKSYSHQVPLPSPVKGGSIHELFDILSIRHREEEVLISSWLVSCLFTDIPRPHLWFIGEKGSGKTTQALCLKKLIDPVNRGSFLYKNTGEMAQIIDHHAVPFFDNFTKVTIEISDLLCSTYSGTDFTKRKQYTNDDDFTFSLKKPVLLSSISLGNPPSDLLDRCIVIEKSGFARTTIPEETLIEKFEEKRAEIFGAILDAAVETLKNYRHTEVSNYSRLADFQRIGTAAAIAFGYKKEDFESSFASNMKNKNFFKLQSFPVIPLIMKFMEKRDSWQGTMHQLQQELLLLADDPQSVNQNPSILSRLLNHCKDLLKTVGIELIPGSNGSNGKLYTLTRRSLSYSDNDEIICEVTDISW